MRTLFAFLVPVLVVLVSCQPELNTAPGDNIPVPPGNDSILLSELVYLDTTRTAPNDTVDVTIYRYNSQKQVSYTEYYHFNNGVRDYALKTSFFYNGTDTAPYKKTAVSYSGNPPYISATEHSFYQYNAQGITIYDSIAITNTSSYFIKDSFSLIAPDHIRRYTVDNYFTPPGPYYTDYFYVFSGENIVTQVTRDTPSGHLPTHDSMVATYDNHPNPIRKAENDHQLTIGGSYGFNAYQRNNFTALYCRSTDPRNSNVTEYKAGFTYEYNINGYPVKAIITNLLGTYPSGNKIIYRYTNH